MPVKVVRSTRNARRKKTAAYVRVSTLEEEQTSSFEGQQAYYISLITSNPDWEFVGIYAVELSTSVQSKNTQNSNSSRSGGTDRVDAAKSIDYRR